MAKNKVFIHRLLRTKLYVFHLNQARKLLSQPRIHSYLYAWHTITIFMHASTHSRVELTIKTHDLV